MKKAIVILAVIMLISPFFFSALSQEETITLYKNDTKFTSYPEYPAEVIDGEIYVPIYFFLNIPDIKYEFTPRTGGFYLFNNVTRSYLSYIPTSTLICLTGEVFVEKDFPLLNSTRYIPIDFAAQALDLKLEISQDNKTVRLSDSSAKLSFDDLILLFNPPEQPPSEDPPSTVPDDPPSPPIQIKPENKYVYLTFEDCPNENTDAILNILDKYNVKAVFFCNKENIQSLPEQVLKILSKGHTLGLHSNAENQSKLVNSISSTVREITDTNISLFEAVSQKSRLWRFPNGTAGKFINEEMYQQILFKRGYIVWDWNLDSHDFDLALTKWDVYENCKAGIERNETSYIRFSCTDTTADSLDLLLSYISEMDNIHLLTIDETTYEYNFFS